MRVVDRFWRGVTLRGDECRRVALGMLAREMRERAEALSGDASAREVLERAEALSGDVGA